VPGTSPVVGYKDDQNAPIWKLVGKVESGDPAASRVSARAERVLWAAVSARRASTPAATSTTASRGSGRRILVSRCSEKRLLTALEILKAERAKAEEGARNPELMELLSPIGWKRHFGGFDTNRKTFSGPETKRSRPERGRDRTLQIITFVVSSCGKPLQAPPLSARSVQPAIIKKAVHLPALAKTPAKKVRYNDTRTFWRENGKVRNKVVQRHAYPRKLLRRPSWDVYVRDASPGAKSRRRYYEPHRPDVPEFQPRGCQKGACYTVLRFPRRASSIR